MLKVKSIRQTFLAVHSSICSRTRMMKSELNHHAPSEIHCMISVLFYSLGVKIALFLLVHMKMLIYT